MMLQSGDSLEYSADAGGRFSEPVVAVTFSAAYGFGGGRFMITISELEAVLKDVRKEVRAIQQQGAKSAANA